MGSANAHSLYHHHHQRMCQGFAARGRCSRMAGQGAAKRSNARRIKARRERKKAAQQAPQALSIPSITEVNELRKLLTRPEVWFVPAETALEYDPALDYDHELDEEDDGLGYYEDGVKRTLTDEQIEMFRHSEMEMIQREERLHNESLSPPRETTEMVDNERQEAPQPAAAASPVSSIEDDLLGLAGSQSQSPAPPSTAIVARAPTLSSRSETSSLSVDPKKITRKREIPYQERHKRKWENYIEDNDPVEGSLTHRRIVREMDELHDTSVELDY